MELRSMVQNYCKTETLYNCRTVALCIVGYAGFLRFDERSRLKCYDILISEKHTFIFIESSKTDQYRDGSWIPLSRTPNITCPVKNLQRYAEFARYHLMKINICFVASAKREIMKNGGKPH